MTEAACWEPCARRIHPWDDDIDIAMRKEDLKRFIAVAPSELRPGLFMQTPESDPEHTDPIYKIRDLNSLYLESGDNLQANYQKGCISISFRSSIIPVCRKNG